MTSPLLQATSCRGQAIRAKGPGKPQQRKCFWVKGSMRTAPGGTNTTLHMPIALPHKSLAEHSLNHATSAAKTWLL
eukprot:11197349-Lingulodinium_polyedra.AAC.1